MLGGTPDAVLAEARAAMAAGEQLTDYQVAAINAADGHTGIHAPIEVDAEYRDALLAGPVVLSADFAAEGTTDRTVVQVVPAAACDGKGPDCEGCPVDDEAAAQAVIEDRPGSEWIQGISQP